MGGYVCQIVCQFFGLGCLLLGLSISWLVVMFGIWYLVCVFVSWGLGLVLGVFVSWGPGCPFRSHRWTIP